MDGNKIVGLLMIGIGLDVPNADLRVPSGTFDAGAADVYVRSLMAFTATAVRALASAGCGGRSPTGCSALRPYAEAPRRAHPFSLKWRCG